MSGGGSERRGGIGRTVLLSAVAVATAGLAFATPWLIRPYPAEAPWFESTATFPRFGLALAAVGALVELVRRRSPALETGAEELDASASHRGRVAIVVALFVAYGLLTPVVGFAPATVGFLALAGMAIGLPLRVALLLAASLGLALWAAFGLGLRVAFGGWI